MTPPGAVFDSNVLLRFANPVDPAHLKVVRFVRELQAEGVVLHIVPQNLYELWVVATRPVEVNGLGLTPAECDQMLAKIEASFPLLADQSGLLAEWRKLVVAHECKGKVAHDARLVAAMRAHGISRIATFNVADFTRYPGLIILNPDAAAPATTPPPAMP